MNYVMPQVPGKWYNSACSEILCQRLMNEILILFKDLSDGNNAKASAIGNYLE